MGERDGRAVHSDTHRVEARTVHKRTQLHFPVAVVNSNNLRRRELGGGAPAGLEICARMERSPPLTAAFTTALAAQRAIHSVLGDRTRRRFRQRLAPFARVPSAHGGGCRHSLGVWPPVVRLTGCVRHHQSRPFAPRLSALRQPHKPQHDAVPTRFAWVAKPVAQCQLQHKPLANNPLVDQASHATAGAEHRPGYDAHGDWCSADRRATQSHPQHGGCHSSLPASSSRGPSGCKLRRPVPPSLPVWPCRMAAPDRARPTESPTWVSSGQVCPPGPRCPLTTSTGRVAAPPPAACRRLVS
eukprot:scaffold8307_cov119-Isochrysis_galbana.AAC.7